MNCEEIRDLLYDYTKNEVSINEISEIETHLKNCPDCESELAHVKGISSLIKASMEEPHESIYLNISRSIKPAVRKALNLFKPALAAALVLVVAGAGFILYNSPYKAEAADVPGELMAGYAVVDDSYLAEEEQPAEENPVTDAADGGNYASDTQYYTGGYTPVSYIIGQ